MISSKNTIVEVSIMIPTNLKSKNQGSQGQIWEVKLHQSYANSIAAAGTNMVNNANGIVTMKQFVSSDFHSPATEIGGKRLV